MFSIVQYGTLLLYNKVQLYCCTDEPSCEGSNDHETECSLYYSTVLYSCTIRYSCILVQVSPAAREQRTKRLNVLYSTVQYSIVLQ